MADKNARQNDPDDDIEDSIPKGSKDVADVKAKDSVKYGEETFTRDVQLYKIIGVKTPFDFYMVKKTSETENTEFFPSSKTFREVQILLGLQEEVGFPIVSYFVDVI